MRDLTPEELGAVAGGHGGGRGRRGGSRGHHSFSSNRDYEGRSGRCGGRNDDDEDDSPIITPPPPPPPPYDPIDDPSIPPPF